MADRIAVMRDGRIEQVAAPRELYERPVNRFVAGFVGRANLLDGTLSAAGDRVDTALGLLPQSPPPSAASRRVDGPAIHPRAVRHPMPRRRDAVLRSRRVPIADG